MIGASSKDCFSFSMSEVLDVRIKGDGLASAVPGVFTGAVHTNFAGESAMTRQFGRRWGARRPKKTVCSGCRSEDDDQRDDEHHHDEQHAVADVGPEFDRA